MRTSFPTNPQASPGRGSIPPFKNAADSSIDLDTSDPRVAAARARQAQENERAVVEDVLKFYKTAAQARLRSEMQWLMGAAFRHGHQWVEADNQTGMLRSLIDRGDDEERLRHITVNLIRENLLTVGAAVTQTQPDVSFVPLTSSDTDRLAASEYRAINAHCNRQFDHVKQLRELADLAQSTTTAFCYVYWDKNKSAEVSDPMTGKTVMAPVGDLCEEIIPAFNLYPDPQAKTWPLCPRLLHHVTREVNYLIERYGEVARGLIPDTFSTTSGYLETRLDYINRDYGQSSTFSQKNSVNVYTDWIKPCEKYPQGRYTVVAGNRVLRYMTGWPCAKTDEFPFIPLAFSNINGTLWGENNTNHQIELQRTYNRIYSRILERMQQDKLYILSPKGAESGADAWKSDRHKEIIPFNSFDVLTGQQLPAPVVAQPPPLNAEWMVMLDRIKTEMQEMSGARDVARGDVPPGVTAAQAIQALQAANASQLGPFLGNIESFIAKRAEWRAALYAQFADTPRLIGLDENNNPADAAASVQAFRGLRAGGQARVVVAPGSAAPKSPEAQEEKLANYFKLGLFGPPTDPGAAKIFWEASDHAESDKITQDLIALRGQLAQEAQQNALQAQQVQQQHEAETLALTHQHESELEAIHVDAAIKIHQHKHECEMQKLQFDKTVPGVNLTATADPEAVVDLEAQMGLQGKVPPAPQAKASPSKPANR